MSIRRKLDTLIWGNNYIAFSIMALSIICGGLAICAAYMPVDEKVAYRTAESMGFTEVSITGKSRIFFIGCGRGDTTRFSIVAKDPSGKIVDLYVCASYLHGAAVRIPEPSDR